MDSFDSCAVIREEVEGGPVLYAEGFVRYLIRTSHFFVETVTRTTQLSWISVMGWPRTERFGGQAGPRNFRATVFTDAEVRSCSFR